MKKFILTTFILLSSISLCYAEPVPQQEQSSADTPYYMDSNNILREKQKPEETEVQPDESEETEILPSEQENTSQENSARDDITDDKDNPINYDASQENMQDKNFQPAQRIEEPSSEEQVSPAKTKKQKKVKKNKKDSGVKDVNNQDNKAQDAESTENSETSANEAQEQTNPEGENSQPTTPKTYSQDDYEQIYRDMPVPTFTFVHGVDPDQYYDMKDSTWSPYPLFRLNAPLYFKSIVIPPGYYLLTPRKYKGDWYILFKEAGVVKYTIPVFAKDYTSEFYYRDTLKELDMGKTQRWQIKFLNAWGKYIRKSKRRPATKTNIELTDLDNNFLLIDLYYGAYKYSTIFRTERF